VTSEELDALLADPTIESLFESTPNVEDVTFDSLPARFPGMRNDLPCGECGSRMELRESRKFPQPFYGCTGFPECRGTHGAHTDGTPLGRPADKETKVARMRAHAVFDLTWKQKLVSHRGAAYNWMRQVMGLTHSQAHIGMFDRDQCELLIRMVYRDYPGLMDRYARLIYDEDPFGLDENVE
jgi:uncharacterized protein DUF3268